MAATYADVHAAEDPCQNKITFGRVTALNRCDIVAYNARPSKASHAGENRFYTTLQG